MCSRADTELPWGQQQPSHRDVQDFYAAADRALPATLKPLVAALLPFNVIFDPVHPDRPQQIDTGQDPMSPSDVWALCQLVLALLQVCSPN